MTETDGVLLRRRGPLWGNFDRQGIFLAICGAAIIFASLAWYQAISSVPYALTPEFIKTLEAYAYSSLALFTAGIILSSFGVKRVLRGRLASYGREEPLKPSTFSWIALIISQKSYSRILALSALLYGVFFAFTTGTISYQPSFNFFETYGSHVPSAMIITCCGPIGQVPIMVVYVTDHLGLLIIPLNALLVGIVSWLVGLNVSLSAFAYRNRPQGPSRRWLGGFGSVVSLFSGCPTCAGILFSSILGGGGAVSVATALASLQALFIAIGIPVLLLTPYLTASKLVKSVRECLPSSE